MKSRALSLGLAAAVIAAGLATAAEAADKPVYGVLLKTLSNPFWGAMEQGIRDGAQAADVEYFMQAVESDQAAEPQLNTCNTMLERKPAVMITAAINSTILLPCLKQANDMGMPVVDLDANLDHAIAAKAGVKIAFTIGSDNTAAGGQGADYLVSKLGKDLYDRLRTFTNHFSDIGKSLDRAVESYNRGVGSLEARVLVTARKFKERGAIAGEEIEIQEPVDKSARPLSLDEGGLFPELVAPAEPEDDSFPLLNSRSASAGET